MTSFKPLSFILSVAAIIWGGIPATAQTVKPVTDCFHNPGASDSCSPIVGCLIGEDIYFVGQALGWNKGTFAGKTNAGFACYGTWVSRNAMGVGRADIECDNGRRGGVLFLYQEIRTGTAVGNGMMENGAGLKMWSGKNIQQFIINRTGDVNARLMCGETEIPLG